MKKDCDGNEIRYYKVDYLRDLAGSDERLHISGAIMAEISLKQMLYDFDSRYKYIVLSAVFLPDYEENEE